MNDKLKKQKQNQKKKYDPDLDLLFKKTIRILMKRILNTAFHFFSQFLLIFRSIVNYLNVR